jgi:hypothetical protein
MKPFKTYADHISPKNSPTLCLWDKPSAEELEELVFPYTYCPNVAETEDDSNWEYIKTALDRAQARTQKARRRVARLIRAKHGAGKQSVDWVCEAMCADTAYTHKCVERVHALIGLPVIDDETGMQFLDRLEQAADQDDYTIRSFRHWATPYDIITIRPNSAVHEVAVELASRLENYPVLDENDVSERELDQFATSLTEAFNSLTIEVNGVEATGDTPEYTALWCAVSDELTASETPDYCDTTDLESALEDLGFEYNEETYTWSGALTIPAWVTERESE